MPHTSGAFFVATMYVMIAGIDEVGRGALAGPVTVAAVVLGAAHIDGLTDSKLLSKKHRAVLEQVIKKQALSIGIGWVSAKVIDRIGMSAALKLAAETVLKQITVPFDEIIIDGTIKLVDDPRAVTMKKADLLIASVSAASVVAKEARDSYMTFAHDLFPEYGFDKHVGYGSPQHLQALTEHGPSRIHRLTFAPIATGGQVRKMLRSSGSRAEEIAAEYLRSNGYKVIDQNWKTKWCEVDIVASKKGTIYFVEVKYRRSSSQGRGFDYITRTKQKQMRFAATLWQQSQSSKNALSLAALEVSGADFQVTGWLPNIDAV